MTTQTMIHTYYCPCCGHQLDAAEQRFDLPYGTRIYTIVTCRQGTDNCAFSPNTVSVEVACDADDLLNRYKVQSKYNPLTGELLP